MSLSLLRGFVKQYLSIIIVLSLWKMDIEVIGFGQPTLVFGVRDKRKRYEELNKIIGSKESITHI